MFLSAFGRPAEEWEIKETLAFVKTQKSRYDSAQDPGVASNDTLDAWSDLSHVLMNSAEFIYVSGGIKGGTIYGETDEYGYFAIKDKRSEEHTSELQSPD